jgi:poly-gamma-glutamate synthesis protein (capsule biosynthesis protein)
MRYVELAEHCAGAIERPVDFAYIWGHALLEFERVRPDVRIVNLETSVTVSDDVWQGKAVNYRMNPANVECLTAARLDCCVLANNHVLDWGRGGLVETLDTLRQAGLQVAGAGRNEDEAAAPARVDLKGSGRVLVFAFATPDSGVPRKWNATRDRPGIGVLDDLDVPGIDLIAQRVLDEKRPGDIAVLSIHWGGNWGFDIGRKERDFAHRLIDSAGIDVLYGHSSHHVKGIEVYQGRPVLYGCGDFLNDYEGIDGYDEFRPDLSLMYFPVLERSTGKLLRFVLIPKQIRRLRVNRAPQEGIDWMFETLNREGARLGTKVERGEGDGLELRWR